MNKKAIKSSPECSASEGLSAAISSHTKGKRCLTRWLNASYHEP